MSPAGWGARGTHGQITLTVVVQRKQPNLPRYLLVPTVRLAGWRVTETIVVDTALNDRSIGRRTLKRWDARRWFVELPDRSCRRVGIDVGQRVTLTMRRASTAMPRELAELVQRDPSGPHRLVSAQRVASADAPGGGPFGRASRNPHAPRTLRTARSVARATRGCRITTLAADERAAVAVAGRPPDRPPNGLAAAPQLRLIEAFTAEADVMPTEHRSQFAFRTNHTRLRKVRGGRLTDHHTIATLARPSRVLPSTAHWAGLAPRPRVT
jgi:hypothetical protein